MDFSAFYHRPEFVNWQAHFKQAINFRTRPERHGDLPAWLATVYGLPALNPSIKVLNQDAITIGKKSDANDADWLALKQGLEALIPWRKGPFNLFDIYIDTEWRSDWKWQRLLPHISSLTGRKVLDVGCGNGYHCWRMLGEGADYVLGIDPSMRFSIQHMAIQKYAHQKNFDLLPLGIEDMPTDMPLFDSVFSMGVLYHRRNPINHLNELKSLLSPNGELILESLIIDQEHIDQFEEIKNETLMPKARYAQMRNVWSIMTVNRIQNLLEEAGFNNIRCVDQNVTSLDEQRSTEWMRFHSLPDYLDPDDQSKTIEGYPAPKRAIFVARKPA